MPRKRLYLLTLALVIPLVIAGCSGNAPTPTRPAPTQVSVVTVVITPTPQPPTPTSLPTPTEVLPTAPLTVTVPTDTPAATSTRPRVTPRATATRKASPPAATPSAVALRYPAPVIIGPVYNANRKDERHYPADALIFTWQSVTPLQGNECYQINVVFSPGGTDTYIQCDPAKATQVGQGLPAQFTLNSPRQGGLNYGSLLPTTTGDTTVNWNVLVVKDDGAGTGPIDSNGTRHKTTPLSPKSDTAQFPLKGG